MQSRTCYVFYKTTRRALWPNSRISKGSIILNRLKINKVGTINELLRHILIIPTLIILSKNCNYLGSKAIFPELISLINLHIYVIILKPL